MVKQSRGIFILLYFFCIFLNGNLYAQDAFIINTPGNPPYNYADQSGIMDRWLIPVITIWTDTNWLFLSTLAVVPFLDFLPMVGKNWSDR